MIYTQQCSPIAAHNINPTTPMNTHQTRAISKKEETNNSNRSKKNSHFTQLEEVKMQLTINKTQLKSINQAL